MNESRRPLPRVDNMQDVLVKLMHEREPLYLSIADFRVSTDECSVRAVVDDVLNWLDEI